MFSESTQAIDQGQENEAQNYRPTSSHDSLSSPSLDIFHEPQLETGYVNGDYYGGEWEREAHNYSQPQTYTQHTSGTITEPVGFTNDYNSPSAPQSLPTNYDSSSMTESFVLPGNTNYFVGHLHASATTSSTSFPLTDSQPSADYFENNHFGGTNTFRAYSFHDSLYQQHEYPTESQNREPDPRVNQHLSQRSHQPSRLEESTPTRPILSPETSIAAIPIPYNQRNTIDTSPDTPLQSVNNNAPGIASLKCRSPTSSGGTSTCCHCRLRLNDEDSCVAHKWRFHADIEGPWLQGYCRWGQCDSPQHFPTARKWLQHVDQRHEKRVRCPSRGCQAEPFGNKADLRRHRQSVHEPPTRCPYPLCKRRKGNLNRRDKRNEHALKYHGAIDCTVADCQRKHTEGVNYGFSTEADLNKHMTKDHPPLNWRVYTTNFPPSS